MATSTPTPTSELGASSGKAGEDNYSGLEPEELILRDVLAAGRTELANERTLLAYLRTALAIFAAGVTFVHFFDALWLDVVGWAMVPIGAFMIVVGGVRYKRMNDRIKWMQDEAPRSYRGE